MTGGERDLRSGDRAADETSAFGALQSALDAAPAPVSFWWRDDDAGRAHPRLGQLLELAARHEAPVGLAVVPAWLEPEVAAAILACPLASVLQHGWCHANRSSDPARPCELIADARAAVTSRLLDGGRQLLESVFGARFVPILVPPWNQIDEPIAASLHGAGFVGLSAMPPLARGEGHPLRLDAVLDLVVWPTRRWQRLRGIGTAVACAAMAREISTGRSAPIGILSHHLVMDRQQLAELDQLLRVLTTHPKARLLDPGSALTAVRRYGVER